MFKRKRLIIFLIIISLSLLLAQDFFRKNYVAPILMYHSVSPTATPQNRLSVAPQTFQRQMQFIKKFRYNVMPLEKLADLIREKKKIPGRTVAITFDDGYKDNFIYAFPVLKRYNLPATIFIITDEVGRSQNDRLNWNEIREMRNSGLITFGSHTLSHPYLPDIASGEELKRQIADSKKILEARLQEEINIFSYPVGGFNAAIRQLVIDAGYKLAVTTSPGKKFANNDVFALKRLRISATSDNLFVFWIETSGLYTFFKERRDAD